MEKLNIEFHCIQKEDLERIMEWRMQPEITRYMNTDPILTINDQINWYHHIMQQQHDYYWIVLLDNIKIGIVSLVNPDLISNRIHTGLYIAVKEKRSLRLILDIQWNLYEFAFEHLHYNKVCEEVFSLNKNYLRILDMCGSKQEGELKEHIYKNGTYYDIVVRGLLKSEWDIMRTNLSYNKIKIEDYK